MKYSILTEFDPLRLEQVFSRMSYGMIDDKKWEGLLRRLSMEVYTDGEIGYETKEVQTEIDEYYLGKIKYKYPVDLVCKKSIYLKNHSYAITIKYSFEPKFGKYVIGWHRVPKEVKVYVANPEDKDALIEARNLLKKINNQSRGSNNRGYYNSKEVMKNYRNRLVTEQVSDEVYIVKRTKVKK